MYQDRLYRNWVDDEDLVSFTVKIEESDLFIRADKILRSEARRCLQQQRKLIQEYISRNPEFSTALEPYSNTLKPPPIIREMIKASSSAGIGPMAAVAGAISEYVGKELLRYSQEVIVENGGDIFLKTNRVRRVGIFAGKSSYTGKLAVEIAPSKDSLGICTSSGTVGPSLSFGQADAAVVLCRSAILADAWATRLGNMVKSAGDIDKTIKFVKNIPEILGVIIILGKKMGVWGKVKLVKS